MGLLRLTTLLVLVCLVNTEPQYVLRPIAQESSYCGEGYWRFGQNCLKIHYHPETWYRASLNCRTNGQQLLEIQSGNEYAEIVSILRKGNFDRNSYWVGVNLDNEKYRYVSNGGSEIPETFWTGYFRDRKENGQTHTITRGKSYCGYLNSQLFLFHSTQDCDERLPYICESRGPPSQLPLETEPTRCPSSWTYDKQRRTCYFVSEPGRMLSHYEANDFCRQKQGALLAYEGESTPALEGILSDWEGTFFYNAQSHHFGCKAITWKLSEIADNIFVHCEARLRFICERRV